MISFELALTRALSSKQKCSTPSLSEVIHAEMNIAVAASKHQDLRIALDLHETDLDMIINPLPLLSAIQTLIKLSDIPFQPLVEEDQESNTKVSEAGIITTSVRLNVDNTSVLFMTDKKEIFSKI